MQKRKSASTRLMLAATVAAFALVPVLSSCGGTADSKDLVIKVSDLSATPKFYPLTVDGIDIEVMALKGSDGVVRVALGTCEVCGESPMAYYLIVDDGVQCQNCKMVFPNSQIGITPGGCQPIPILADQRTDTADTVTVSFSTLQTLSGLFPEGWKKN